MNSSFPDDSHRLHILKIQWYSTIFKVKTMVFVTQHYLKLIKRSGRTLERILWYQSSINQKPPCVRRQNRLSNQRKEKREWFVMNRRIIYWGEEKLGGKNMACSRDIFRGLSLKYETRDLGVE